MESVSPGRKRALGCSHQTSLKYTGVSVFIVKFEIHMPRKYGPKAQKKVEKVMHEYKRGELKSGRSGKKVKSRKQAIAIGLSEARRAGAKVPKRKKS